MDKELSQLKNILFSKKLPEHQEIFDFAQSCSEILEQEVSFYRENSVEDIPGSLLDFSSDPLPMVVIPDIHARPDFIANILEYKLPEGFLPKPITVFKALEKKQIRVVCVGDALHTERTRRRWNMAMDEFDHGIYTGPAMSEEMLCGLNTICGLMRLKKLFPEHFHFLKGNHENIYNKSGEGDYAFKKYADEGSMVRHFLFEKYGDDIIFMLSCVENSLPLMVCSNNCVISHAEPVTGFNRYQIVNARLFPEVIEGLTWTDNGRAEEGSVASVIMNVMATNEIDDFIYLGGHRTVPEVYLTRQDGRYVQFHNPAAQNVALVNPEKKFNPDYDIVSVINKEE